MDAMPANAAANNGIRNDFMHELLAIEKMTTGKTRRGVRCCTVAQVPVEYCVRRSRKNGVITLHATSITQVYRRDRRNGLKMMKRYVARAFIASMVMRASMR